MVNAGLSVSGLCLEVGTFRLQDVAVDVPAGGCCVLLGPTGCGKSLLAESICGLRRPQAGRVLIAGRDVTALDPSRRNIGYLPQDYALLPFQTVRENLAFALAARRTPPADRRRRVEEMLDLLGMGRLAGRKPARLSGGERQRVALGRALIANPDLLVLDEPLSALDDTTRQQLIEEILALRCRSGVTALHICHSLEEALHIGESLAIMREGRIVQAGTAAELYARPRSYFVARLLGLPCVLSGEILETAGRNVFCIAGQQVIETQLPAGPAWGTIAPEYVRVSRTGDQGGQDVVSFRASVARDPLAPLRPQLRIAGAVSLVVPHSGQSRQWSPGMEVHVTLPRRQVHVILDEPPGS